MSGKPTSKPLAKLLDIFIQHAQTIFTCLVVLGVCGSLAIPLLERNNHFDENALLAGSARPTIRINSANKIEQAIRAASIISSLYGKSDFQPRLKEQLQNMGLQVSQQPFNVDWPYGGWHNKSCVNMHSILPSLRGDGKEAMLLVTPLNMQDFHKGSRQGADVAELVLSLGLSLLSHLSSVSWLAKDLVWLLPDASCGHVEATQAWVDKYTSAEALSDDPVSFIRGGVMQQAVVLEVVEPRYNAIELSIEGYDGQLPKLDTYWLLYYFAKYWTSTPVLLQHQQYHKQLLGPVEKAAQSMLSSLGMSDNRDVQKRLSAAMEYLGKVICTGQFSWRQARGLPLGAHAPFKEFGVDAATMRLVVREDGTRGSGWPLQAAVPQLGEVLENAIRSCSVLIERFHHSYFLYLLTGPDHFVTVERYIVPLVLLIGALVVQAANANHQLQAIRLQRSTLAEDGSQPHSWGKSFTLVAMVHLACLAVGCCLRLGPSLLVQLGPVVGLDGGIAQLQQLLLAGQGGDATWQQKVWGWGCGSSLVLLMVCVELGHSYSDRKVYKYHRLSGRAAKTSADGGEADKQQITRGREKVGWLQVKVILVSFAAAVMAGVACLNWALAYMTCLVLMPLVAATGMSVPTAPVSSGTAASGTASSGAADNTSATAATSAGSSAKSDGARGVAAAGAEDPCLLRSRRGGLLRAMRWLSWLCFSPVVLVILMTGAHDVVSAWQGAKLQWLVLESRGSSYGMFWAVYMPFWLVCGPLAWNL